MLGLASPTLFTTTLSLIPVSLAWPLSVDWTLEAAPCSLHCAPGLWLGLPNGKCRQKVEGEKLGAGSRKKSLPLPTLGFKLPASNAEKGRVIVISKPIVAQGGSSSCGLG